MHALIQDGAVATFPYSETQFRRDNPRTSFPRVLTLPVTGGNGTLVAVTQADRPTLQAGETAAPAAAPTLTDGAWVLGWTVRDMTAGEEAQAIEAQRLECQERIYAVCDATAQTNLAAAAAAGLLSAADLTTYRAWLAWVEDMRLAWREYPAVWPAIPPRLPELAARF